MSNAVILCNKCQMPIQGRIASAMGKTWHPEHFTCNECGKPIGGDRFNQKEGKPYCEEDFSRLFLERCAKCEQPIKERVLVALERNWHPEHFTCTVCNAELSQQAFCEKDGHPYCLQDFQREFSPQCAACKEPITGFAVVALNKKYHQQCFQCSKCKKAMEESFQLLDGSPFCDKCAATKQ